MTALAASKDAAALELKAGESGEFVVRLARTRTPEGEFVVDKDGDAYAAGAIGTQSVSVGCINHSSSCPGPAGRGVTRETSSEILVEGKLDLTTEQGRYQSDIWKALGDRARFSYMYRVLDSEEIRVAGQRVRLLKRVQVLSLDLVQNPAGIDTALLSLKSADCGCSGDGGDLTDEQRESLRAIKARLEEERGQQLARIRLENTVRLARMTVDSPAIVRAGVPERVAKAAEVAAAVAARELEVPLPVVRWYRHGTKDHVGFTRHDGVIWIADGLDVLDAAGVAAHEVKHTAEPHGMDHDDAEVEAQEFAAWFIRARIREVFTELERGRG